MNTKQFYSQFREDEILSQIFPKKDGHCIEIGGFDGVTGSNTYYFEKLGWDCIIVEPIPELHRKILANRKCTTLNYAVSDRAGETDFFVAEGVETLSSLSPDKERIRQEQGVLNKIRVKTRTLDSILEEFNFNKIDFITIDVEGHEMEVLKGFSLSKYKPEIVIIEDGSFGFDSTVRRHLERQGYVRFRITGCNEWYTPSTNKELYNKIDLLKVAVFESYRMSFLTLKKIAKRILRKAP